MLTVLKVYFVACLIAVLALIITAYWSSTANADEPAPAKPLCVLVGAPWCPACRSMEATMPSVDTSRVSYYHVNVDERPDWRAKLQGSSIPQLVLIVGGKQFNLVGAHSASEITSFINGHLP